ncbi:hypothetical protein [Marinifilum caeruleilacunae]|uniref:Uncharacterized protein n=1 Tax=Marinifilum caeruleilacunae TaxID=2499076 RepID=A0ABX1WUH0_9BACT|nr:hypothetical protein [Marinifilum caeruleilacunae]NOU59626.1 hypothetical protein [Marinifilum caeruleilacunae]
MKYVKPGMTISEIKSSLVGYSFDKDFLSNYGIDSELEGTLIKHQHDNLLFVWTKYNSGKVFEVIVLNPKVYVDGNIRVGSTLNDFTSKYSDYRMELDAVNESTEYAYSKKCFYVIEFISNNTPVSEYNADFSLNKVVNSHAIIDRIRITMANKN